MRIVNVHETQDHVKMGIAKMGGALACRLTLSAESGQHPAGEFSLRLASRNTRSFHG
ncbi:protein of unknown function [Pseudodesulfovibrio piezophilus C1TLV30]|uniref:Uncharacterized protein n=1 Tax=Pseudodesulfovibrio piezophilus (strain DSM 21447 / JCM 15486 / C1TLV30) TaxID=1322246 RepID=M1WJA3_PSEP2|nr:protein of unknown function [Pseudodesulfovibrio piezophilus C1TLV30]